MKKLLLISVFIIGLGFALFNFKGLATKGEFNSIIINFRQDIPANTLEQNLSTIASKIQEIPILNSIFSEPERIYIIEGDKKTIKKLRQSDLKEEIEYIEPNYIYHSLEQPNDPQYTQQWNLRSINVEQAWDETKGEGITVAVIDTGVTKVPDLDQTEFVEGYDFVNNKTDAQDDVGHGTHVAGTIAQSTNNNYGVAGIAYQAKIMPLKVLGVNGGTVADIAEAIKFATDHNADVINMSLGGGGDSQLMRDAIQYAHDKGVVIIAAAGNENRNSASFPARYPQIISVAATDSVGNKAPYSNFGAGVDISAPGGSETGKIIQETIVDNKPSFIGFQGTSMASPHVAGVAALIKATGVENPDEVREILIQSARKIEKDPLNHYGAGQLDAGQAVKLALKGKITPKDFLRWLKNSGYLNPGFWLDGGTITLLPKLGMVLGSYLLAWFLRNYLTFNLSLATGLVTGSSGLFFLQGLYIFDLPQWPLRLMGSSVPELGNVVMGTTSLNPFFASALIPLILILLFLSHPILKWISIGCTLGVASCLTITAFTNPFVWGFGYGLASQIFLLVNAVICFYLASLASKTLNSTSIV
ncbi:S8 family peptidase [Geminocystis sp. NIES-3709]|uniref:S8 family peptidase n=1 Tax=Geminocystis sp. NIES-3709 TaxID=1617448 RepID=UPI0005FC3A99|nr:S8 family peptidase [Geminocystis sp. NIES-3709]BAQ66857.1 protease [Geminocystis sp. NIES-3709]